MSRPKPGLLGGYRGTCIVCMRPTDTALAFRGEGDWLIAGLMSLGIPRDQAYLTLLHAWREHGRHVDDGMVPSGTLTETVRVCHKCVRKAGPGLPDPVLCIPGAEIPGVSQKGG